MLAAHHAAREDDNRQDGYVGFGVVADGRRVGFVEEVLRGRGGMPDALIVRCASRCKLVLVPVEDLRTVDAGASLLSTGPLAGPEDSFLTTLLDRVRTLASRSARDLAAPPVAAALGE